MVKLVSTKKFVLALCYLISIYSYAQNCNEPDDLSDTIILKAFGTCYINDPLNNEHIKRYTISKTMRLKDPGLIYLILNARSMKDSTGMYSHERQTWFNIYPLMRKDQISNLYNILLTERIKLQVIEKRYNEKKVAIMKKHLGNWNNTIPKTYVNTDVFKLLKENKTALSNYNYEFIGSTKYFHKPELWRYDFNEEMLVSIYDDSTRVKPSEFVVYKPKINEVSKFDYIVIKYIQDNFLLEENLQLASTQFNELYTKTFPAFSIDYLTFGLSYFYKKRMLTELGQLLLIEPKHLDHCQDKERLYKHQMIYHKYNSYYHLSTQNYEKACQSEKFNLINGDYDDLFNSNDGILFQIFSSTNYSDSNCKNCSNELNSYLLQKLRAIDIDKLNTIGNVQTEFMHSDFIELFNKNKDIVNYAKQIIFNVIKRGEFRNRNIYKDEWSYALTNIYIKKEFPNFDNIDKLKFYADSLIKKTNNDLNPQLYQSTLFEFYTYYLLYTLKNNKINSNNQFIFKTILEEAVKIGNNSSIEAYFYIEKSIIYFIGKKLNSQISLKPETGKIYGIIIGISDYIYLSKNSEDMNDLTYAAKDATDFSNYLTSTFGNSIVKNFLVNNTATTLSVKRTIQETLINRVSENDIVYIYFSGHGRTTYANENYLLCADFKADDEFSGIEFDWLVRQIRESKARKIFVFIDACKSGQLSLSKDISSTNLFLNELNIFDTHKVIFTSSSNSQNSFEDDNLKNGIFTYYLIKGLNGHCRNSSNDQYVRLNDLREYLIENVYRFKKQIPNVTGKLSNEDIPISIRKIIHNAK